MTGPTSDPARAAGSARTVSVPIARLGRWIANFSDRHGQPIEVSTHTLVRLTAPDGATAILHVPFPPLARVAANPATPPVADPDAVGRPGHLATVLTHHLAHPRLVGALLVRRGGVAVGVFHGDRLINSKIETAYVQGRTKAGGWSQQRFARRRANQAHALAGEAAELAVRLLLPHAAELALLVRGGDRTLLDDVLADTRLEPVRALPTTSVLAVPDPRQAVLEALPAQFLSVRIDLNDLA